MTTQENQIKQTIARIWDVSSETYDSQEGHGIQSEIEREAWKRVFKRLLPPGRLKILDVGCGTCEIGLLFAEMGHHVTGLDLSEKMLAKAREKASKKGFDSVFKKGDAEAPPFEEDTFDVVVNRHLLWTLPHPDTAVMNWKKVMKKGGVLIVVDGVWNDGTFETKARRFVSDFCTLLAERRNPRKGHYSREINSELPNCHGVPPEKTLEYFKEAGLKNVKDLDLKDVREIQKKKMPFRKRIAYNYKYHLLYGEK
ncbi:SAM-dependent methlyltransferase [Methanosarcina sp. 2.H.T.1A.6]|uniref:class I SAM-dependent methyltransferase n=1 Tax=unclassified Methanosarcina TaxID=2644672 RepID=UPI0006212060|nr:MULTISPECIES: class I SAM-dependent methyltransferase [unclassified Methanosarcina]KKG16222.1 SAM-dependent methlyltransferase [Methanosarcina sp. 2.H.T.1A.3]KKG20685.1 SAM-dependent methlyltransferase [Methanosarcina sp. 2.H.T.1A.15]KKG23058.1 SAM-dependent methlyltransferase [Methanosarcina sp. 2.H.T.1A.6]KKG26281.1 SAM-dependent methlyltransferase [Methanosarcina sp. 2.H.T.1A.8]